jgi:hypothetical protein
LANPQGGEPDSPASWGWRHEGGNINGRFSPKGIRVGWVDGQHLYLEPDAAYTAVQKFSREAGEPLPISPTTLWKALSEKGFLLSKDSKRETLKIRKTLDDRPQNVLHLATSTFAGAPQEPDKLSGRLSGEDSQPDTTLVN